MANVSPEGGAAKDPEKPILGSMGIFLSKKRGEKCASAPISCQDSNRKNPGKSVTPYLKRTSYAANAVVLVLPWLLIYNLGMMLTDFASLSGADLITNTLLKIGGTKAFFAYNLALIAAGLTL